MKKKIFAIALAVCMVLTMMPAAAFANTDAVWGAGNSPEVVNEKELDLILSTRSDLSALGTITDQKQNFGIVEPQLTPEDREFTGYVYCADRNWVIDDNGIGHWEYNKFEKMPTDAKLYVQYTAGGKMWVSSLDDEKSVTGIKWTANQDGTYTLKYIAKNDDKIEKNENNFKGYVTGLYKIENGKNIFLGQGMNLELIYDKIAPVKKDAVYKLSYEMLIDPAEYKNADGTEVTGNAYRMWVNGQGDNLLFNSKLTDWDTCFYVTSDQNGERDARFIPEEDTWERRTYIGKPGEFVLQARDYKEFENENAWIDVDSDTNTKESLKDIYTIEYVGAKKEFYPVYHIKYNAATDGTGEKRTTAHYQFRLKYTGKDPYLNNGNENTTKYVYLSYEDGLDDFSIDEYVWNEDHGQFETGNVQHFDTIGATLKAKFIIRPGVLLSVMNKVMYSDDAYAYITGEDEIKNICIYAKQEVDSGEGNEWGWTKLSSDKSPFEITWDKDADNGKGWYVITYAHPENDLYGPNYLVKYEGNWGAKVELSKYGFKEGDEPTVQNASEFFTRKITVNINKFKDVPGIGEKEGYVSAQTEDEVNTTEVIFDKNLIKDKESIEVATNHGDVSFGGSLVDKMEASNKKNEVSFQMQDVLEEQYYLTAAQKETLKNAEYAYDFKLTANDEKVDFGQDGYANVLIPCEKTGMAVYYVKDDGTRVKISSKYDEAGNITFTTKHFSTYMIASDDGSEPGNDGGNNGGSSGGSTGGGGYVPTTPGTTAVDKAKADAEKAITAAGSASKYDQEEQQTVDQIIEKAKADLKNAKTEEEVKAIKEAAQKEIEAVLTAEEKAEIKAIKNVGGNGADGKAKFIAKSKLTKVKGRKAVRISWNEPTGIQLDGYKVYRSTKKNKFGSKPYFTTDKTTYTNTKDLKKGKTYYYKVRGYKEINGEIVYTGWSTNAYRTMK